MSDIEEMVKRLRAGTNGWNSNPAMKAAADALEAQAKRITELEASLADAIEAKQVLGLKLDDICRLYAENDRLRVDAEMWQWLLNNAGRWTVTPDPTEWTSADGVKYRPKVSFSASGIGYCGTPLREAVIAAIQDQSHSANTVGVPTPVMDAAPACEPERSVSESIAAGHPCFDPDGPPDHDWKYVDDSFSHEFGTEICGHYECARCDAIKPE